MKGIKNIIFDLGGVIINLDQQRSIYQFNTFSKEPFEHFYNQSMQSGLFDQLDKGNIITQEFLDTLRRELSLDAPDAQLLEAWNAMLLDIPAHRLDLLVEAKQQYKTFLLSNTCEAHIESFEEQLYLDHGVRNFDDYFDRVYYSCRMGMRKPDKEIFEIVLKENNLRAAETVFIDDSPQHVKGAGDCGMQAFLLPKGMEVGALLKEIRLL